MSQYDFGIIDPQVKTGSELADDLNSWRDALHSTHSGSARPSYVTPGMLWVDVSAAPVCFLKLWDGTADIPILQFNNSTHAGSVVAAAGGVTVAPIGGISATNVQAALQELDTEKYDKTGGTITGSVNLSGSARRIAADFSNAILSARTCLQTNVANGISVVPAMPLGTARISGFHAANLWDPDNASHVAMLAWADRVSLESSKTGAGTFLPMDFATSEVARMRILTTGAISIGSSSALGDNVAGSLSVTTTSANPPIRARNGLSGSGKYWLSGPDLDNAFVIYNQSSVGVYMVDGGTSWIASSDEGLKTDLVPIENACNFLSTVRTVVGRYKTDDANKRRQFLIAQDWESREGICSINKDGFLGMGYTDTIPMMIAAIKELTARVAALEAAA